MKTRSGELPRRQHSSSLGGINPQPSGASYPTSHPAAVSSSGSWGPQGGTPGSVPGGPGAVPGGSLVPRAAQPATPPQQPGGEPQAVEHVSYLPMLGSHTLAQVNGHFWLGKTL